VPVQKGDILIALKAINLTPGISNSDRAVAAALLDHFNRKTGQCDPGIKRLAGLLGVSERTIYRSLNRIEADRLFKRIRHGGHLNRNSYEPNWRRFREIESIWSARMKPAPRSGATDVSPGTGQTCQLPGDNGVTQTCRTNLSKETYQESLPTKENSTTASVTRRASFGPSPSSADALAVAAQRRWHSDLHQVFGSLTVTYGEVLDRIDAEVEAAATLAEVNRRGAGLQYIVTKLRLSDHSGGAR
jgi:hypothetical protein